jgi:hypothetical protein
MDIHLGDGGEADPPWVYLHKTWKWIGKCGDRKKGCGRKPKKGAQYLWGRGRIKELAQAQVDEQVIPESGVELP